MSQDCTYSDVWLTRDEDSNAFGDWFRGQVSSFPVVGGIVAGFVPDTATKNVVRSCPGTTTDKTTGYALDYWLITMIVLLIVIFLLLRK